MTTKERRVEGLRELVIWYHWKATHDNHPMPESMDARYKICTLQGFREWLEYVGETMTPEECEALKSCLRINSSSTADHIDSIYPL